jgi:hypothetical protein
VRVGAGLVAAAAVAGTAFALTSGGSDTPAAPPDARGTVSTGTVPPRSSAPSSTAPSTPHVVRFTTVAEVFATAAINARRAGSVAPGEYRHVTNHNLWTTTIEEPPGDGAYEFSENRNDTWTPADPQAVAYRRDDNDISVHYPSAAQRRWAEQAPGGRPAESVTWYSVDPDGATHELAPGHGDDPACVGDCSDAGNPWDFPTRTNLDTLPRDAAALRESLYRWARAEHADAAKYGKATDTDDIALTGVAAILDGGQAPSDLLVPLYQVAETIHDVTITGSMRNYDGVAGTAVGTTDELGNQTNLIFGTDGRYLGEKVVLTRPNAWFHLPTGTVVTWSAVTVTTGGRPVIPGAR